MKPKEIKNPICENCETRTRKLNADDIGFNEYGFVCDVCGSVYYQNGKFAYRGGRMKKKFNYEDACNYLNTKCGYIDVENDEDYTDEEIIRIAEAKYLDEE